MSALEIKENGVWNTLTPGHNIEGCNYAASSFSKDMAKAFPEVKAAQQATFNAYMREVDLNSYIVRCRNQFINSIAHIPSEQELEECRLRAIETFNVLGA